MLQEQPPKVGTTVAKEAPPSEQPIQHPEENLPPARQPIMWSEPKASTPAHEPHAAVAPPAVSATPHEPTFNIPSPDARVEEPEVPPSEDMIGLPKDKLSDYTQRCKAILAGSKMLDMVMIADKSAKIVTKAARKSPQSSIRRISAAELAKTTLRAHIAKGAFDANAAQTGRASSIRAQYNAMDVILYPLENNLTLLVIGLIEPAALSEVYDLIAKEFPARQKMAMIVDDEADIRKSIEQVLVRRGFKVETAESGMRALEIISAAREKGLEYGIAILDIRMPGMDGFELFRRINQVSPNTKMLFITAFEYSQEDVVKMVSSGRVKLLRKPFKRGDLLQFITDETAPVDLAS